MGLDLSAFTPEQIDLLKAQLNAVTDSSGRSPLRPRQLHDLRLVPTKDDPRPTFFWSTDSPRNAGDLSKTAPYPKLMWHAETGQEITVAGPAHEREKAEDGYVLTSPENAEAPDLVALLKAQLESLSPEDRQVLVAAAQRDRLAKVQEAMAGLSEAELEALTASLTGEPAKRKPGRPKKDSQVA